MASTSERLTDDEVTEILSFLPAKSIVKFRTLSRNVLSCSALDHFLLTQSHRTKHDSGFFTRPYYGLLILTLLNPHAGLPDESLGFLQHTERLVLASANGLVFCSDRSRSLSSLCVCNPMHRTATPRFIPPPTGEGDHTMSCISVDVDPVSRDFKLVCLTIIPEDWSSSYWCRVYVSADDAWKFHKIVHGGPRDLQRDYPVICGRTVYVASDSWPYTLADPYIVAFDIEEGGNSELLAIPEEAMQASAAYEIRIARWPGEQKSDLCLIHYCEDSTVFTLWVMSRDRGITTWTKLYQVSMMEMGFARPGKVECFTLINGDTLVFAMNHFGTYCRKCSIKKPCIYSYSIRKRVLKQLQKGYPSSYPVLIPYANSLRPFWRWRRMEAGRRRTGVY